MDKPTRLSAPLAPVLPRRRPPLPAGNVFRPGLLAVATALTGLLERTGVPAEAVDDVILGHCYPSMEAPAIGRVVALDAGLPVTVGGMQVDRRCGSGLQAVINACLQVGSGAQRLVVAGGAESMSNVVFHSTDMRWGGARTGIAVHDALARGRTTAGGKHYPVPGGMLETAENLRRQYGISRAEQDELAVASHHKAVEAQRAGLFAEEIVPVTVPVRKGDPVLIDTDEHPRADTTVESLAKLKPVLGKSDPEATVTAGNSSGQNDAASMCIVTTPEKAAEFGLKPLVRLAAWGARTTMWAWLPSVAHSPRAKAQARRQRGRCSRAASWLVNSCRAPKGQSQPQKVPRPQAMKLTSTKAKRTSDTGS